MNTQSLSKPDPTEGFRGARLDAMMQPNFTTINKRTSSLCAVASATVTVSDRISAVLHYLANSEGLEIAPLLAACCHLTQSTLQKLSIKVTHASPEGQYSGKSGGALAGPGVVRQLP